MTHDMHAGTQAGTDPNAPAAHTPGARFRAAVASEAPLQVMGAITAYAGLMAKRVGYRALYLSGGGVAANSLGMPDLGISTMEDVLIDARRIVSTACRTGVCGKQACTGWRAKARAKAKPDAIGAVLGATKDDRGAVGRALEEFLEQIGFLRVRHRVNRVTHSFRWRSALSDLHRFRRFHGPFDVRFNLRGNSRGEQRGLSHLGHLADNSFHIGQKAHVEHAVGLIEHEMLHVAQIERPSFQVIEQPTRSGHDDVGAATERLELLAVANAAVKDSAAQVTESRKGADRFFHLAGEFACGDKNEGTRGALRLVLLRKDGEREGGRFAGARLCAADQVAALHQNGDALGLNGSRRFKAKRLDSVQHRLRKLLPAGLVLPKLPGCCL